MSVENDLRELIIKKSNSIRQFASEIDIPVTTIQSMLTSGVENAGVKKVMKICDYLGIETDALAEGYIKEKIIDTSGITVNEFEHVKKYRSLDDYGKKAVDSTLALEYARVHDNGGTHFTEFEAAFNYLTSVPTFAMGGYDIDKMDKDELIDFANDMYEMDQRALKLFK